MPKQNALTLLTAKLRAQLKTMQEAAKSTHEASTGESAKQEGKYDTRGLEASYLADAQAEQTLKLMESVRVFETLELEPLPLDSPVEPGALVEVESQGNIHYYLLTPCAGGISVDYDAGELTTLSPEAPLYQELLGCHAGDFVESADMILLEIN